MIKVKCPWCPGPYIGEPLRAWSCPNCGDTFWDPDVIHYELDDVETLWRFLLEVRLKITRSSGRVFILSPHNRNINEDIDPLLLAFDHVSAPLIWPKTSRLLEYYVLGAVDTVSFLVQGWWGPPLEYSDIDNGPHLRKDKYVSTQDVFYSTGDWLEFDRALRNLSAVLASAHLRHMMRDQFDRLAEEIYVNSSYKDGEQFLARNNIPTQLHNFYRQWLTAQLLAGSSSGSFALGAWAQVSQQFDPTPVEAKVDLVKTILNAERIYVPRDLAPQDILDFRQSKAARKFRKRLDEAISLDGETESRRLLILSDLRRELNDLNANTNRLGLVESVALSGLAAAVGYWIGGVAGGVVGAIGGPAFSDSLKHLTRERLGRSNWAHFFHDAPN